jgi:hypothetical protein
MPFKRDLALQNIPLSKQPFKMQPQTQNENFTWRPQKFYNRQHCSATIPFVNIEVCKKLGFFVAMTGSSWLIGQLW